MCRMLIKREPDGVPYLVRLTHKYVVITNDATSKNYEVSCRNFSSYLTINTFICVDISKIN